MVRQDFPTPEGKRSQNLKTGYIDIERERDEEDKRKREMTSVSKENNSVQILPVSKVGNVEQEEKIK